MSIYTFVKLKLADRAVAIWQYGTCIAHRKTSRFMFLLFSLNGYFVEVRYDSQGSTIQKIIPFHSLKLVEPYLNEIDISAEIS
jgi:hypothetical protein